MTDFEKQAQDAIENWWKDFDVPVDGTNRRTLAYCIAALLQAADANARRETCAELVAICELIARTGGQAMHCAEILRIGLNAEAVKEKP